MNKKQIKRIWKFVKPVAVLLTSILIVFFVSRMAVRYFISHYLEPVDPSDPTPIEIVIPSSSSAGKIARILYSARGEDEPGLIQNTAVFKVYVDFVGKANKMRAGTYILSRNMTLKQIVDVICEGNPPKETVHFTVPEGYTAADIEKVLADKSLSAAENFMAASKDPEGFAGFRFLPAADDTRTVRLEGYLFPDTYEVFSDASAESVITKMLNRFNEVYSDDYARRAAELGLSMDQVVTLASLIEKEAQVESDFAKVSAVFHNRLSQGMKLESCASLSYVLNTKKYTFTESELKTESPYNTYLCTGLPLGPICNPGRNAIEAALYPNEEFLAEGYLYFCNGKLTYTDASGQTVHDYSLVFDKSYEEHQAHVLEYRGYWS